MVPLRSRTRRHSLGNARADVRQALGAEPPLASAAARPWRPASPCDWLCLAPQKLTQFPLQGLNSFL